METVRLRAGAVLAATALVAALIAAALFARFTWQGEATSSPAPVISYWAPPIREEPGAPRAVMRPPVIAPAASENAVVVAPAQPSVFAAMRCATEAGRRANPQQCAQHGFASAGGGDIAPAPVEGVRSHDGVLARTILRAANARAENYARGEAQRYADPREDPLYQEGTDPATAGMRFCPEGQAPIGDGRQLRGQTCRPR